MRKPKACFSKHSQWPPESFRLARLESLCCLNFSFLGCLRLYHKKAHFFLQFDRLDPQSPMGEKTCNLFLKYLQKCLLCNSPKASPPVLKIDDQPVQPALKIGVFFLKKNEMKIISVHVCSCFVCVKMQFVLNFTESKCTCSLIYFFILGTMPMITTISAWFCQ